MFTIIALAVACAEQQGASERNTVDENEERRLALGECADFLSAGSQLGIWDEGGPTQIARSRRGRSFISRTLPPDTRATFFQ